MHSLVRGPVESDAVVLTFIFLFIKSPSLSQEAAPGKILTV